MFGKVYKFAIALIVTILLVYLIYMYFDSVSNKIDSIEEDIMFYDEISQNEVEYLLSLQLKDGAITMYSTEDGDGSVNPYFANLSAYSIAKTSIANESVKEYLSWYIRMLNDETEDPFGIDGTIFDYRVDLNDGIVYSTKSDYDSIDSYAATFLMAINEYYQSSDDEVFILKIEKDIERVYNALMAMESDSLFKNSLSREVKYLMDNTEVVYGLEAYIELLDEVLAPKGLLSYEGRLSKLQKIIIEAKSLMINDLYDADKQAFNIAFDKNMNILEFDTFMDFYPHMTAQIFPVIFDIIEPGNEKIKHAFEVYNTEYGLSVYSVMENGDSSFYWTVQALYYSKLSYGSSVKEYMIEYKEELMEEHPYPIYNTEVAWIILACDNEITRLKNEIERTDPFGIVRFFLGK